MAGPLRGDFASLWVPITTFTGGVSNRACGGTKTSYTLAGFWLDKGAGSHAAFPYAHYVATVFDLLVPWCTGERGVSDCRARFSGPDEH